MRLYLLERLEDVHYDENKAFVVKAKTNKKAREEVVIHSDCSGDEPSSIWLDKSKTSCKSIKLEGNSGVICCSFNAG